MVKLINPNNMLFAPNRFRGDSDDTKPTEGVRNGDEFYETDTSKFYMFDKEHQVWIEWVTATEDNEGEITL